MASARASLPTLVIGAGAWGTAVAVHLAGRSSAGTVALWGRDASQMQQAADDRENKKYLPGIRLPEQLQVFSDQADAYAQWRKNTQAHRLQHPESGIHGLVILATPMSGLPSAAAGLKQYLGEPLVGEGLVWLAKGLALQPSITLGAAQLPRWPHEIIDADCPGWPSAALSGPSFAQEVAQGLPAALTVASRDLDWARRVAQACHGDGLRLYPTDDLIGVELGGAMKNVLAIAAGVCDGLKLGANARAALLTRGLAEMSRLGMAIGARAQTFMGLATLGDLILTATGDLSRNRRVGLALARGERLSEVIRGLGHVAEGVNTAPALLALAKTVGVDVPITESVCRLMMDEWSPSQAIAALMTREVRDEHDH